MRILKLTLVCCLFLFGCEKNQFDPVSTKIVNHNVTYEATVTFGGTAVNVGIPSGTATWSNQTQGAAEGFSSVWTKYVTDVTAGQRLALTVVCTNPPYQATAWATATIYVDGNRWISQTGPISTTINGVLP